MSGETVELQEVVKRLDRIIELLEPCFIAVKIPDIVTTEPKKRRGRKKKEGTK